MKLTIILLFGITVIANAQPPDSLWSWTLGSNCKDEFRSVCQTSDGGFILGGTFHDPSDDYDPDGWLVRTSAVGETLWSRLVGDDGSYDNGHIYWVTQAEDGGFIWAGQTDAISKYWLGKTDANGDVIWERQFPGGFLTDCYGAVVCADGGYLLFGQSHASGNNYDDVWAVKTNAGGESLWTRYYEGDSRRTCRTGVQADDGGYVLAGWAGTLETYSYSRLLAIRVTADGDTVWTREYNTADHSECYAVVAAPDGGFYLAGHALDFSEGTRWLLVKISSDGDSLWSRTYSTQYAPNACYSAVAVNGGIVLAGYFEDEFGAQSDFALLRVSADGDSLWSRTFYRYYDDVAYSVATTSDGGYVLCGIAGNYDICNDELPPSADACVVRTGPDVDTFSPERSAVGCYSLYPNYPNPFNASTTISFELPREEHVLLNVFDIIGRSVTTLADAVMSAGTHQACFDASELPSGIYVYRIETGSFAQSRKLVVLR